MASGLDYPTQRKLDVTPSTRPIEDPHFGLLAVEKNGATRRLPSPHGGITGAAGEGNDDSARLRSRFRHRNRRTLPSRALRGSIQRGESDNPKRRALRRMRGRQKDFGLIRIRGRGPSAADSRAVFPADFPGTRSAHFNRLDEGLIRVRSDDPKNGIAWP